MHKYYIHFWYHCKSEILIHRELLNCYETLIEINKNPFDTVCMQRLNYVLERIMSIETFCDNVNVDKADNKRKLKEFKQYKFDDSMHTLVSFTDTELRTTYKDFVDNYSKFLDELNKDTRNYVKNIIKWMHVGIGLNIPNDLWHGIKLKENPDIFYWHSDNNSNEEKCIRYITNTLKHCYEFESMIETNCNASIYSMLEFHNICNSIINCMKKYYDIRPISEEK